MEDDIVESEMFPKYFITRDGRIIQETGLTKKKLSNLLMSHLIGSAYNRVPVPVDKIGNVLRAGRVINLTGPTRGYEVTKSSNLLTPEKQRLNPRFSSVLQEESDTNLFQRIVESKTRSRTLDKSVIRDHGICEQPEENITEINVTPPRRETLKRSISVSGRLRQTNIIHHKTGSSVIKSGEENNRSIKTSTEATRPASTGRFMQPTFSALSSYSKLVETLLPKIYKPRKTSKEELISKLPQKFKKARNFTRTSNRSLIRTLSLIDTYKS